MVSIRHPKIGRISSCNHQFDTVYRNRVIQRFYLQSELKAMILECRVERKMYTDNVNEEINETKRRLSFTQAFKCEMRDEFRRGNTSLSALARKYTVDRKTIREWIAIVMIFLSTNERK